MPPGAQNIPFALSHYSVFECEQADKSRETAAFLEVRNNVCESRQDHSGRCYIRNGL